MTYSRNRSGPRTAKVLKIGFSGTREGMSEAQKINLKKVLKELKKSTSLVRRLVASVSPFELHHGDCVGADEQAAAMARSLGFRVIGYPGRYGPMWDPEGRSMRAYFKSDETRAERPHLERNKDIVRACDFLVAAPFEDIERPRGGTWSTIRHSRDDAKKPTIVLLPSGSTAHFNL